MRFGDTRGRERFPAAPPLIQRSDGMTYIALGASTPRQTDEYDNNPFRLHLAYRGKLRMCSAEGSAKKTDAWKSVEPQLYYWYKKLPS